MEGLERRTDGAAWSQVGRGVGSPQGTLTRASLRPDLKHLKASVPSSGNGAGTGVGSNHARETSGYVWLPAGAGKDYQGLTRTRCNH